MNPEYLPLIPAGRDVDFEITVDQHDGPIDPRDFSRLSLSLSLHTDERRRYCGRCEIEPFDPAEPYTIRARYRAGCPQPPGPCDLTISGTLSGRPCHASRPVLVFCAPDQDKPEGCANRAGTVRAFFYF